MWRVLAGVIGLVGVLALGAESVAPASVAATGAITVTSASDAGGPGLCPHETDCTLRAAIEAANADVSDGAFTITFDPGVFEMETPATILVGLSPLPPIARDGTIVDASDVGVRIRHADPSLSGSANGIHIAGADVSILGLHIAGFPASCILIEGPRATVGGDRSLGRGNRLANCATGIAVYGSSASAFGNVLLRPDSQSPRAFEIGIEVAASLAMIGPTLPNPVLSNYIGDAEAGVVVVGSAINPVAGVAIDHNVIGRTAAGSLAPVGVGVALRAWSSGTFVRDNVIANAGAGITIAAVDSGPPVTGNRLSGNSFLAIQGMAIDLGADGVRNPNDDGDEDTGPNTRLNHPLVTRATQSRIEGTACAGCEVQLYAAFHVPGGAEDYGSTPLPGGVTTTDAGGNFAVDSPPVSPGEWVTAITIDAAGNTSEFGPSSRVGAGAVQCGNLELRPGWNHVGYFGPQTVILGDAFSADPGGGVTAIYRAIDGSMNYERWFKESVVGRTLSVVQPGESYWMFASQPVTLAGGFSVSFPIPVELAAGWNDFVYVGATADIADALAGLRGSYRDLYAYDTEGDRFLRYGNTDVPEWAQEFGLLAACSTYQVFMLAPATLVPLQP